jgi:hypothetical protein
MHYFVGDVSGLKVNYKNSDEIHHSPRAHARDASFCMVGSMACFARIRSSIDDFRSAKSDVDFPGLRKIDIVF